MLLRGRGMRPWPMFGVGVHGCGQDWKVCLLGASLCVGVERLVRFDDANERIYG